MFEAIVVSLVTKVICAFFARLRSIPCYRYLFIRLTHIKVKEGFLGFIRQSKIVRTTYFLFSIII